MESRFVFELQLGSVTRAGQLPRQVLVGGSFFCLWLTGSVLSCGAPAAQPGWLVFVEVTVSFSVFKRALASLLLCSDGDGLAGTEVAYREDSSFGISGTFLTMLQPSALPAGWAGTTCGEHSRAGCC